MDGEWTAKWSSMFTIYYCTSQGRQTVNEWNEPSLAYPHITTRDDCLDDEREDVGR